MEASALLRPCKIALLQQLPAEQFLFFKWFLALTEFHRPSGDLDKARAAVLDWAAKHGVSSATDEIGNILLSIPASPGKESVGCHRI
jgi:dipeptidase D